MSEPQTATTAPQSPATPQEPANTDPKVKEQGSPATANPAEPAPATDIYRPEGLPDHYLGEDNNQTIDNLFKAVDGFRKDQSKTNNIPEKLDDYKIELPDEVASTLLKPGEDGKDHVYEHMRGVFHENGVAPDIAANIMSGLAGKMSELLPDGTAEGVDYYEAEGGIEKVKPQIDAQHSFLEGLKSVGRISDNLAEELSMLTIHPNGLKALNELREAFGDKPIPIDFGGATDSGAKTETELNEMMEDPRYWKEKDPVYIAEVTKAFEEFYNGKSE